MLLKRAIATTFNAFRSDDRQKFLVIYGPPIGFFYEVYLSHQISPPIYSVKDIIIINIGNLVIETETLIGPASFLEKRYGATNRRRSPHTAAAKLIIGARIDSISCRTVAATASGYPADE
jgi:hypothetical protein